MLTTSENMEQTGTLIYCWGDAKWHSHFGRQFLIASCKTEHTFTIQSNNHATWNISKRVEDLCPHTKNVYSVSLIMTKTWKQPRCFSIGK